MNEVELEVENLKQEIIRLKDKLNLGSTHDSYEAWLGEAEPSLKDYIESMAAAFCKYTDINPHNCVLHVGITDDKKILYWFEEKSKNFKKSLKIEETREYING